MTDLAGLARRPAAAVVLFAIGTALFSLAYCQAPLYYSNQNQYFLHGLARAGEGLAEDWLARTLDPTPVFSALVAFTARYLHPWLFHVYYALLQGAYAAALVGLFVRVARPDVARRHWPVFAALLVAAHAALLRWCSYRWLGQDYPWYLQAGVAGQYVLGAMFQPSTFGVLLVVAVCLFAWGRVVLAAVCVALAATVHSTYLLPGALLVAGFMTALVVEGRLRQAVGVGALALLLVLPVSLYVFLTFRPTGPETFAASQWLLAHIRIPHHATVDLWLDRIASYQLIWMGAGIALARPRLRIALAVAAAGAVLLTLVQVWTESNTLALLFPWRLSAVLMPIATAVILSRLVAVAVLPAWSEPRRTAVISAVVVLALAAAGVWIMVAGLGFQSGREERGLLEYARRTRRPGDMYFVPVTVPELAQTTRGSLSSDFKPIADKRRDARVIPPDLQGFRLATGVPIFVDFKSIPYKDIEVAEWYYRLIIVAEGVQKDLAKGEGWAVAGLRGWGVTHVVVPAGQRVEWAGVEKVFEDEHYRVYRIADESKRD
jgi:hypothetical protein